MFTGVMGVGGPTCFASSKCARLGSDHPGARSRGHAGNFFEHSARDVAGFLERILAALRKHKPHGNERDRSKGKDEQRHTAMSSRGPHNVDSRFGMAGGHGD